MRLTGTILVAIVLKFVTANASMAADNTDLKRFENVQGEAVQTNTLEDSVTTSSCQVTGGHYGISIEPWSLLNDEAQKPINSAFFSTDEVSLENKSTPTEIIMIRSITTPDEYCQNSQTGHFYPVRSLETLQTLTISENSVSIREEFECGFLVPTKKIIRQTLCKLPQKSAI